MSEDVAQTNCLNALFTIQNVMDELANRERELLLDLADAPTRAEAITIARRLSEYTKIYAGIAYWLLEWVEQDEIDYANELSERFNAMSIDLDDLVVAYRAGDLFRMKVLLEEAKTCMARKRAQAE